MDTVPEFHANAPQATVSEGLAQGPYVVARAGVKPMTLRTKGIDSTNAPHTPPSNNIIKVYIIFLLSSLTLVRGLTADPTVRAQQGPMQSLLGSDCWTRSQPSNF